MKKIKVRITFTEAVLGTWPSNQNIAREFIASKSPDASTIEDEVAALGADAVADKGMTVFPRNENGDPILYDYQIKGFFKDSCGMLSRIGGKAETAKKKASASAFPTVSRFPLVRLASLKLFFWTILTRRSCSSGWTTALCVASASGATVLKGALLTKSSINRYGRAMPRWDQQRQCADLTRPAKAMDARRSFDRQWQRIETIG